MRTSGFKKHCPLIKLPGTVHIVIKYLWSLYFIFISLFLHYKIRDYVSDTEDPRPMSKAPNQSPYFSCYHFFLICLSDARSARCGSGSKRFFKSLFMTRQTFITRSSHGQETADSQVIFMIGIAIIQSYVTFLLPDNLHFKVVSEHVL